MTLVSLASYLASAARAHVLLSCHVFSYIFVALVVKMFVRASILFKSSAEAATCALYNMQCSRADGGGTATNNHYTSASQQKSHILRG